MAGLKCLTFIYTIDKDMNNTACVLSCNAYVFTTQHTGASGVENKRLYSPNNSGLTGALLEVCQLVMQLYHMQ